MPASNQLPPAVVVEAHFSLSLSALCRASGAEAEQLQALVSEGLLQPSGGSPDDWQFDAPELARARDTLRLARELDLSLHAAALVLDLLAEIERLRAQLR